MSLIFRLEHVDTVAITVLMAQDRARYSQPQLREALQKSAAAVQELKSAMGKLTY